MPPEDDDAIGSGEDKTLKTASFPSGEDKTLKTLSAERPIQPPVELACIATEINGPLGEYKYYYSQRDKRQYRRQKPTKRTRKVISVRQRACMNHWKLADAYYTRMPKDERLVWRKALKKRGMSAYDLFMSQSQNLLHRADPEGDLVDSKVNFVLNSVKPNESGGFRTRCSPKTRTPTSPPIKECPCCGVWYSFEPAGPGPPGGTWKVWWVYEGGYMHADIWVEAFIRRVLPGDDADWLCTDVLPPFSRNWSENGDIHWAGEKEWRLIFTKVSDGKEIGRVQFKSTKSKTGQEVWDDHGPCFVYTWVQQITDWHARVHLEWTFFGSPGVFYPGKLRIGFKDQLRDFLPYEWFEIDTLERVHWSRDIWLYEGWVPVIRYEWRNEHGELKRANTLFSIWFTNIWDFPGIPGEVPGEVMVCAVHRNPPTPAPPPPVCPSVECTCETILPISRKTRIEWTWPNEHQLQPGYVLLDYFFDGNWQWQARVDTGITFFSEHLWACWMIGDNNIFCRWEFFTPEDESICSGQCGFPCDPCP